MATDHDDWLNRVRQPWLYRASKPMSYKDEDEYGDYMLEVTRDKWFDHGWEQFFEGAPYPPKCFEHPFKSAIQAGWIAAHNAEQGYDIE